MSGPWFCYLLECADTSLYTGITIDLERRVAEHNRGVASKYTRARLPVRLVYAESQPDRGAASRRERVIKRMGRGEKLGLVRRSKGVRAQGVAVPGGTSGLRESQENGTEQ